MLRKSLWIANGLVYLALALLVAFHLDALRWVARALPGYLRHAIALPGERALLLDARAARAGDRSKAERLLERSLGIDPYGEAALILAALQFDRGDYDSARGLYERYLAFDRTVAEVYLKISAIHEYEGRHAEAVGVLGAGARYFAENAEKYRPVHDDEVDPRFNRKAEQVYDYYCSSQRFLAWEAARVAARGPSATAALGSRPP